MKKSKQILVILLLLFIGLSSCGLSGDKVEPVEFEVYFFNKLVNSTKEHYPTDFKSLICAIKSPCVKKTQYFPLSLKFKRCDLNEKRDMEYLKNAKGDKTKIAYVNKQLQYFLRDSLACSLLSEESKEIDAGSIIQGFSGKRIFIYSDEDIDSYSGFTVYHGIDEMKDSIGIAICEEKLDRVIILYKPNISEEVQATPSSGTVHKKIKGFQGKLEIEHDEAKNWRELYNKAENFILTEEEHAFNHPSAYCYIVCAAEKAIETGQTQEMYEQMRLDCPDNSITKNICRLKTKAHVEIWNKVLAGVRTKDSEALEALEEHLFADWDAHLKGEDAEKIIEKFEGEIEHADAKNWQELYYKAAQYLLSEEEHAYDHPSAYCYIVCAAEKAIATGKTQEMKIAMETVCNGSDTKSKNLCKLRSGHEKNWNIVMKGVANSDSKALEDLEESIMSRWIVHLKGQ